MVHVAEVREQTLRIGDRTRLEDKSHGRQKSGEATARCGCSLPAGHKTRLAATGDEKQEGRRKEEKGRAWPVKKIKLLPTREASGGEGVDSVKKSWT